MYRNTVVRFFAFGNDDMYNSIRKGGEALYATYAYIGNGGGRFACYYEVGNSSVTTPLNTGH